MFYLNRVYDVNVLVSLGLRIPGTPESGEGDFVMRIGSTCLLACLLALGCGDDDGGGTDAGTDTGGGTDSMVDMDTGGDDDAGAETRSLSFTFDGLPALGAEYVYEGWIIVDDAPITTGRFTVDAEGNLDPATFEIDAAMADAAAMFRSDDRARHGRRPRSCGHARACRPHRVGFGDAYHRAPRRHRR